jgi:S-adenosylmethionine:tRNA ribosyltransferase-isomerase
MGSNFNSIISKYNYSFPSSLIAQKPATPRDSARLLIYDRKKQKISLDVFKNLYKYLPTNSVLVFNKTKVIPARLILYKPTGGKVEILYLELKGNLIKSLANREVPVGSYLFLNSKISFKVKKREENYYLLEPSFNSKDIFKILEKYGETPIPPYIKNSPLSRQNLKKEYQTIFAEKIGSVAAPTASLHFTKSLLQKIKEQGFRVEFITLHVGLGTFASLRENNFKNNALHKEIFEIDPSTIKNLNCFKSENRPIIAVGTTTLRALESATSGNRLIKTKGSTDLFIKPGYKFKLVDGLITNFHVPKSSLLMLVSALIPRLKLLSIYKYAISKKFRLFSFGDGMLIK